MIPTIQRVLFLGIIILCSGIVLGFHNIRISSSSLRVYKWIDDLILYDPLGRCENHYGHASSTSSSRRRTHPCQHHTSVPPLYGGGPYSDDLIVAACQKLIWETFDESRKRPVLDLSSRQNDDTFKDISKRREIDDGNNNDKGGIDSTTEWDQGQRWNITKQSLSVMGIDVGRDDDNDQEIAFLRQCPQLLRLEPSTVVQMAEWVIEEFGVTYLQSTPQLLAYRVNDAIYGLHFLSLMMMVPDAKPSCSSSGTLLVAAIQGGIQECAVKDALGSASSATSQASQAIAADAIASYRQLLTASKNPKLKR